MENNKEVTENTQKPVDEPTQKDKTFTQDDVNNIVAKNVKEEMAKMLKKLNVEDFDNAKSAIDEYKKHQDAQKSELDKALEKTSSLESEAEKWKRLSQEKDLEIALGDVLGELEVDTKHKTVLKKLIDNDGLFAETGEVNKDSLKSQLDKIIEEQLPMLKGQPSTKVGVESKDAKPIKSSQKGVLDEMYKNSKYYK